MKRAWKLWAGIVIIAACCGAQTDPGPRGGAAGAGGAYPTLSNAEQSFFSTARSVFQEVDSVQGTISGESGVGLGPTFNGNSCAQCHAQPDVGGSSPKVNPQVALATLHGANNTVPSFITADGPVREARFISTDPTNVSAPLDGGVHGLYTIQGRSDASGCTLAQPNFAFQLAQGNVTFRIPTPTFGLGLVENTPDATLQANLQATASQRAALGVGGRLNTSGNDGSVTKFGWKAQNKSLRIFGGEAYNVEQGVSNEIFPNERSAVAGCIYNATPEDHTVIGGGGKASFSDVDNFAGFMRLSAPPAPATPNASQTNGQSLFTSVGCALCHSTSLVSAQSPYTGMSNVTYHPYSDFALHHMGANLADGIMQGSAGPDEFRSAPLWGVGQRLFFLHDGRAKDLLTAILDHADDGGQCTTIVNVVTFTDDTTRNFFMANGSSQFCGSEANKVIQNFKSLGTSQKQDLLNFLRSL
jgi:CxxC motif-containing protein (DUF1111 family)